MSERDWAAERAVEVVMRMGNEDHLDDVRAVVATALREAARVPDLARRVCEHLLECDLADFCSCKRAGTCVYCEARACLAEMKSAEAATSAAARGVGQ